MEIRSRPLTGKYFLGCKKMIYGVVALGHPELLSASEWNGLRPCHRVSSEALPYKKTYGLPILSAHAVRRAPYRHPRGAVAIVKYRCP